MSIKSRFGVACVGMMLAGTLGVRSVQGKLVVDLRQNQTNAKQIVLTPADVNKPINIDVYVQVTGAAGNPEPELFQLLRGTFVSSGGIHGPIAPVSSPYDHLDPSPSIPDIHEHHLWWGDRVDADGDGDLDLGDPQGNNLIFRFSEPQFSDDFGGSGKVLPDGGAEFYLGRISFTPTSLSGSTAIQFKPYSENGQISPGAGLWMEDGMDGASIRDGATGQIISSDFVIVPEPSSLCLLGLAGTTLLRRGRRQG